MLISVVIPSYNHSRYIEQAVRSVLEQTHRRLELIVIDDGSKDDSLAKLAKFSDRRLRVISQENAGAHAAINRGLELAQGDYLAILNSDDVFHPHRLAKCLDALNTRDADLVCTWIEIIDAAGKSKGIKKGWSNMRPKWAAPDNSSGFWQTDDFTLNLLSTNFVSTTSNIVFRRTLFDQLGGMRNLRFAHDWDFMLRVATDRPCVLLPEPLMQYRVHGSNTISSNRNWMLFEVCWVLAANLFRFEGTKLYAPHDTKEQLLKTIDSIGTSLRFQGCDRLFWMVRQFIETRRKLGCIAPEEDLLEDVALREQFLKFIEH